MVRFPFCARCFLGGVDAVLEDRGAFCGSGCAESVGQLCDRFVGGSMQCMAYDGQVCFVRAV